MRKENIYEAMQNDIMNSNLNEEVKRKMLNNVIRLKPQKVNIMITGSTGCGKSSTINALFDTEIAKVGVGVDPETMDIERYELDNLVLWDTPGLGDGKENDKRHAANIIKKLSEKDANGNAVIDMVLVILDGGSRDLGTSYELINNVIIPNLGEKPEKRMLVAINQADMAMKGRYWDYDNSIPKPQLVSFLNDKVRSVKDRVREATGVKIDPIYYSAGYKEEGEKQSKPYNLSKLLYYIVENTPSEKRLVYVDNLNPKPEMWEMDDREMDYNRETKRNIVSSVISGATAGVAAGSKIGAIFGAPGAVVGGIIGGIVGGAVGLFSSLF